MPSPKTDRRQFLRQTVAAGVIAGTSSRWTAASYARVLGANERIRVGLIGCGGRGRFIIEQMVVPANANMQLVAINDIWTARRESYPAQTQQWFGSAPRAFADCRALLDWPEVDAVIIATPDHQHGGQLLRALQAGKHAYVEKPIAPHEESLAVLNQCLDAAKASQSVVQHGTQGSSSPATSAMRDLLASGTLGKLFRVESSISLPMPYWHFYSEGPQTASETDWQAFLDGKPDRPFDRDQHVAWMGYYEFSSGPIAGWLPHFSNLVHAVTGCSAPRAAMAWGGRYRPSRSHQRTAPDQVCVVLEYDEGFHTQFVTHFGNQHDAENTRFMCEKGLLQCRFGHDPGNPTYSSEGVNDAITPQSLLDAAPPYPGAAHVQDWAQAIRGGSPALADMELGYRQGVAVALGEAAFRLQRKVAFDPSTRTIQPL